MIPLWTRGQWLLRVVIVLAPLTAVLVSVPAGATLKVWFVLLLLALSILFALFPTSLAGVGVALLVAVWWAAAPDELHPLVLVAAAALLLCHVAALLTTYGPERLPVDPALIRLWVRRAALVFLAAPAAWVVAVVMTGEREEPGMWVAGLGAALVGGVAAIVGLASGSPKERA